MLEKNSTIIGTLMEIESCQIHGQVSQGSPYGMKPPWMDFHGQRGDWQENKRHPDQTLCGQRFGKICLKRRNAKKSKSGLSKNRSSTILENCLVFTSLIQMMKNWRISWRMRAERGSSDASRTALQDSTWEVQGDLSRWKEVQDKIRLHCWGDESTRKRMEGSLHKYHEDHIAGKGMNSLSHYNLVHKFIPVPQAMKKYQMHRQQWKNNG